MTEKPKKVPFFLAPCADCRKETRHETLHSTEERGDENYDYVLRFSILACLGCGTKSCEKRFIDIDAAHPISHDEWETPQTVENFPKFDLIYHEPEGMYLCPKLVRQIYDEALLAIREEALILGGLGLRATIEAICNEQKISGKSLDVRIGRLASQGLISLNDAGRLHAIRFLGNDAAHDIKSPEKDQISVAIKIIHHLIHSVYILEKEMEGKLDAPITKYDTFIKLLSNKLKDFSAGDEYPIANFLSKDIRRVAVDLKTFEVNLISDINSSNYASLKLGKVDNFAGSSDKLQHFIVV